MWLALGSTDMRGVTRIRIRRHDRRERTFALAHAMRDAVRTDVDAYNDSYRRSTLSSLHTWRKRLRLKHSTNLKRHFDIVIERTPSCSITRHGRLSPR